MDFPFRHWAPLPRRFPCGLQVANTNYVRDRRERLQRCFVHCSFGFIFRGRGHFWYDGTETEIEAPCVYSACSGEWIDNGPYAGAENAWDQLYMDFEVQYRPQLEARKLLRADSRVWPMANPNEVWELAEELCALSLSFPLEHVVDRVDRLVERIILESRSPRDLPHTEEAMVQRVIERMRRNPKQPFVLAETARLSGMSEATFRRRWMESVRVSPRRFLEEIRAQEACRLLAESALSIKEVALRVGYQDEFYFSRRFHMLVGKSPREYRLEHQPGIG